MNGWYDFITKNWGLVGFNVTSVFLNFDLFLCFRCRFFCWIWFFIFTSSTFSCIFQVFRRFKICSLICFLLCLVFSMFFLFSLSGSNFSDSNISDQNWFSCPCKKWRVEHFSICSCVFRVSVIYLLYFIIEANVVIVKNTMVIDKESTCVLTTDATSDTRMNDSMTLNFYRLSNDIEGTDHLHPETQIPEGYPRTIIPKVFTAKGP